MNIITTAEVKEVIAAGKFFIKSEYCAPERVTESALRLSEDTGLKDIKDADDSTIESAIDNCKGLWTEEDSKQQMIKDVLTYIADSEDDNSGFNTITPVVHLKNYTASVK